MILRNSNCNLTSSFGVIAKIWLAFFLSHYICKPTHGWREGTHILLPLLQGVGGCKGCLHDAKVVEVVEAISTTSTPMIFSYFLFYWVVKVGTSPPILRGHGSQSLPPLHPPPPWGVGCGDPFHDLHPQWSFLLLFLLLLAFFVIFIFNEHNKKLSL